jgi:hypothetical protein
MHWYKSKVLPPSLDRAMQAPPIKDTRDPLMVPLAGILLFGTARLDMNT